MDSTLNIDGAVSVFEALKSGRQRETILLGQLDRNQGRPTFTGRMTLEQFVDLTQVQNRRWASEAGETIEVVTQREIIDGHALGLAEFMMQGLVSATIQRAEESNLSEVQLRALSQMQSRMGQSAHYGLPQVTLVLSDSADARVAEARDEKRELVAARLFLPAGRLFSVADGQHRRDAARRVREFLNEAISNRRTPRVGRLLPAEDAPLTGAHLEAWSAIQETFRAWTTICYEAHIGLGVEQARQLFSNYNCNVKPVKLGLNLSFDQSNPVNLFAKQWLQERLPKKPEGQCVFDLRQLASINGLLFLGKTSIRRPPFDVHQTLPCAQDFWTAVMSAPDWNRSGTLLREVPVLKGLAKCWFYVFVARRNNRSWKADQLRSYLKSTKFNRDWVEAVPGLPELHQQSGVDAYRFSPAHNDIVARIASHALADTQNT